MLNYVHYHRFTCAQTNQTTRKKIRHGKLRGSTHRWDMRGTGTHFVTCNSNTRPRKQQTPQPHPFHQCRRQLVKELWLGHLPRNAGGPRDGNSQPFSLTCLETALSNSLGAKGFCSSKRSRGEEKKKQVHRCPFWSILDCHHPASACNDYGLSVSFDGQHGLSKFFKKNQDFWTKVR